MALENKDLKEMLRWLILIRSFEEKCKELIDQGEKMIGLFPLSVGQEAVAVGACFNLSADALVFPYIRDRGILLMRGIGMEEQFAVFFDKKGGVGEGRWAHWHMGCKSKGIFAQTGTVGSTIVTAIGVALAVKLKGLRQVVLNFFGDGASNTGYFHEGLNFAGVHKLPIVFICVNNFYAVSTPISKATAVQDIATRAQSYGFPGFVVDGNDILEVHFATQNAIRRVQEEQGPTLIECRTYRWYGETYKEDLDILRDTREKEVWKRKCPIEKLKKKMLDEGVIEQREYIELLQRVEEEIASAIHRAKSHQDLCPSDIDNFSSFIYAP